MPLLPAILPWFPAVTVVLYLKFKLIGMAEYTEQVEALIATRAADRTTTGLFSTLAPYLDQLSFFRADLFLSMVVIPACLLVAIRILPTTLSTWLPAGIGAFVTIVFYIQRQALVNTGMFIGWNSILDAADWGLMRPDDISNYLSPGGLIRTGLLLFTIVLLAVAAGRFRSGPAASFLSGNLAKRIASVLVVLVAVPTLAAWLPATPTTWLHASVFSRVLRSFFEARSVDSAVALGANSLELQRQYRALTGATGPPANSPYRGLAAGYNLVVVVLETAPAKVLDFSGSLDNLPNVSRLKKQAWVATNHYSTFPNSAPALFSLMSSFYGGDPRRLFSRLDSAAPSFLHGLAAAGYRTALYLPNGALNSAEVSMYRAVGFGSYHHPSPGPNDLTVWSAPWRDRERLDRAALTIMLDDIRDAASESSPFAAVFFPQISHAPWVDVFEDGKPRTIADRGRGVFSKVDRYIGDIIQTLEQAGSLDQTLIVVTGDHGIRVHKEDPSLPLGKADAYSFHVPFLLYAPGILDQTAEIPWLTSHIDVGSTLVDLYGLESPPASTQGAVMWDPTLARRTTFFWAEQLHGSVGLHRDGTFLMWNTFYDRVYQNSTLSFDSSHVVPNDSEIYAETTALFRQMQSINRRWINLKILPTQSRSE